MEVEEKLEGEEKLPPAPVAVAAEPRGKAPLARFLQLTKREPWIDSVCECWAWAFRLPKAEAALQRRAFGAVALRLWGMEDRVRLAGALLDLAFQFEARGRQDGLRKPIAKWQADVNELLGQAEKSE